MNRSRREFIRLAAVASGVLSSAGAAAAPLDLRHNRWADYRQAGPLMIRADFNLGNTTPLFDELALLQRELIRTLAITETREPTEVYLFADEERHRSFVATYYPRVPYRQALYIRSGGTGRVFAFRQPELATDLRHECTHAFLHASQPMVPLWLDEGLAEYFELPAHQRVFDHPHLQTLRWNLRLGIMPSLQALEAKHELSEMGGVEYRFAWAWSHFMLHGPREAHRELVHFLADTRAGVPPGRLSVRLQRAIPDVEKKLVAHFKYLPTR